MPSPRLNRLATLLLAVSLFLTLALPTPGQGIPWHVVPLPIPGGFVDAMTGGIHVEIPVASFPQRNSDPLVLKLMYDGGQFHFSGNAGGFVSGGRWQLVSGTSHSGTGFMASSSTQSCPSGYPNGSVSIQSQPAFTDSHGTTHVNINSNLYTKQVNCYTTGGTPYGNGSDITSFVGVASDGSGYIFSVTNYNQLRVTSPGGWLVYDNTAANNFHWPEDTNGNYIEYAVAGQPDTLGRSPVTFSQSGGCPTSGTQVTVHASDGSPQTYTLNCTTMSVSDVINGTVFTNQEVFPTSFVLPDGTQYTFTYDRLTSACEVAPGPFVGPGGASSSSLIGSNGAPGPCNLTIAGNNGFLTTYLYDILDNLQTVSQTGVGSRTFAYDSLSRLTSATNPESGAISYTYDANGNLATKVAPAPNQTGTATVTTTYSYDALNRLTSKTYSDGTTPSVTLVYDSDGTRLNPIGRLVESVASSTPCSYTYYDYDPMGRTVQRIIGPPADCHGGYGTIRLNYSYDQLGDLLTETDDLTYIGVTYGYNAAARLTSVTASPATGWNVPSTLISGIHYNALGKVTSDTLQTMGSTATESRTYSNRGWLTSSSTTYNGSSGCCSIYSLSLAHSPNGDVTVANDSANGNWTYGYDAFNRLVCANLSNGTCAAPTNGQPTYNYVYDRFGNRWQQNGPHTMLLTFSGSNNRMDGYSYDAAGNLLNDGTHSYTYDAENRIYKVDGGSTATYLYDAEGHAIEKTISASNNQYETAGTWDFLYDLSGRVDHEIVDGQSFWRGEVFAGVRHLATFFEGDTYFDEQDQVGTDRARFMVTHDTFQLYNSTIASLPFGDALTLTGAGALQSPDNFTGQRRDPESGLDDFGARYYGSPLGHFMSPDEPLIDQEAENPQSWNLYAYVLNNPLNNTDPTGNACVQQSDGTFKDDNSGGQSCADSTKPQQVKVSGSPGFSFWDGFSFAVWLARTTQSNGNKLANLLERIPAPPEISEQTKLVIGMTKGFPETELPELLAPAGSKLAQIIARLGIGHGNPTAAMQELTNIRNTAAAAGQSATGFYIRADATIYRVGSDYLTVAKDGTVLSYVKNATPGEGVASTYTQLGGK